jgi:hypothetical protein
MLSGMALAALWPPGLLQPALLLLLPPSPRSTRSLFPHPAAVHADDPAYRDFNDISELPPHRLAEIRR